MSPSTGNDSRTDVESQGYGKEHAAVRKAAKASFVGNFVEWFDYATYG